MNDKLTTGGDTSVEPQHHEIHHPDFAFITKRTTNGDLISATRVPKLSQIHNELSVNNEGLRQYVLLKKVKHEARHKVASERVWIKGLNKRHASTRQLEETKPENTKGYKVYVPFDLLEDDEVNVEQRQPVSWTDSQGRVHENALWVGSGDGYLTPDEITKRIALGKGGLGLYHKAHTAWNFMPTHAAFDAMVAAHKAMK